MARNLFDDEDWDRLGSVVAAQLDNHAKRLEAGALTELHDQGERAHTALAEIANQGSVVRDALNAAIADVGTDQSLLATLRGVIGSGGADVQKQRQISQILNTFEANLHARVAHLQGTRKTAERAAPADVAV